VLEDALAAVVGDAHVLTGDDALTDHSPDEALSITCGRPPGVDDRGSSILRLASEHGVSVTARGSGTGLSGAAVPAEGALVVSFARMNRVLEIDTENHVAVVQPGVGPGRAGPGGLISGEHGIGRSKRRHHRELTDPVTLALLARVKAAFDPSGIVNPDVSPAPEEF
jgi:FAD/FMN-containing dehydrogenase